MFETLPNMLKNVPNMFKTVPNMMCTRRYLYCVQDKLANRISLDRCGGTWSYEITRKKKKKILKSRYNHYDSWIKDW